MQIPSLPLPSISLPWLQPSPLQVWTVEPGALQLTWGDLPHGEITIETPGREDLKFIHDGGAGGVHVDRLPTGPVTLLVRSIMGAEQLTATIPAPPPGEELCRIATVSDIHLGSRNWGALRTVTDIEPDLPDHYDMRCATGAVEDAVKWGASLLVIKGDAAHHRTSANFELLGNFVDRFPKLPMILIPGNHDVDDSTKFDIPQNVGKRGLPVDRDVRVHDMPGVRVIAADTSIDYVSTGTITPISEDIIAAATSSSTPNLVLLHHQFQRFSVPTYWPPGIPAEESKKFLAELGEAAPRTLVSSGHTHRNRIRRVGPLLVTEVCSTKDWPGCWAGYRVFEGGIYQVVQRVSTPSAIRWTEHSRRALLGLWSPWSPGKLSDRGTAL